MITNEISVEYSDHMGNDLTVVNAARQSFSKQKKVFEPEKDVPLINYLATGKSSKDWDIFLNEITEIAKSGDKNKLKKALMFFKREAQHWAPFAHPQISLRITIPIALARQIVKHHVGMVWSEESRRYIDTPPDFYIPSVIHKKPSDSVKQGRGEPFNEQDNVAVHRKFIDAVAAADLAYGELVHVDEVAGEEARMVLSQNMMINATLTGSLATWARVYNQRIDLHAQLFANEFAEKVGNIIEPLYPYSWAALVN